MFHTVNINRPVVSEDSSGGQVFNNILIANAVPAFVQPASAKLIDYYEQRGMEITHMVFFAADIGATMGDIIIYGTRNLRVSGYRNMCELSIGWVAGCQELQNF